MPISKVDKSNSILVNWKLLLSVFIGLFALGILIIASNTNFGVNTKAANATCSPGDWGPRVPCTISACGGDGCPADQRMNKACPAGATNCSACCYQSAIGKCSPAAGCGGGTSSSGGGGEDGGGAGRGNGGGGGNTGGGGGNETNNTKAVEACYTQNCQNVSCGGMSFAEIRRNWRSKSVTGPCRNCVGNCMK